MVPYGSKGNFKARLTQDIDLGTADSDVAKELLQQVQDVLDGVIPVPSPQTIIAALEKEIANLATYLETDPPEMNEDTLSEISGLQNAIGIIQALEYHRSIIDGGVLQSTKDV
jgi:hypothetical protein